MTLKMIGITIGIIISQVICLPPKDLNHADVEKLIWDYLEYDLRDIMINKWPVIDPYEKIPEISFQYNDNKFLLRAKFNDLGIKNLSYYDIMYCSSDFEENVIFGLNFPIIIANGTYDVNICHLGNDIKGQGQFNLTITDLRVQYRAKISLQRNFKRNTIHFKSLTLNIIPGIFKFIATNIYLDNEQESNKWSNKVSKLMPMMIFDSHDVIEPFLSNLFIKYLNN